MENRNLDEIAASVSTRSEFIEFLESLKTDFLNDPEDWENNDLGSFLEGFSGFAQSLDGYYMNRGEGVNIEVLTWRMLAQMLLAATVYE